MSQPRFELIAGDDGGRILALEGDWTLPHGIPRAETVYAELQGAEGAARLEFNSDGLGDWDSSLPTFVRRLQELCEEAGAALAQDGLPDGVRRLLSMAAAVPQAATDDKAPVTDLATTTGEGALELVAAVRAMVEFVGEVALAFVRLAAGRARYRARDIWLTLEECGPQALPIVTLISFLVGLILAFVGAIQLRMFGAQLYVADLVGIAIVRELGAVMTGIVMAGRTGAAFAAQLGSMQVNEEIDAFKTLGISPVEFLVIPRILALVLMMPLLCLYADLLGVFGGLTVGVGVLGLNVLEYWHETTTSVTLNDLGIGLFMSAVFGVLVAGAGCLRGLQCGRSSSSVGIAATKAVVTGIVSIIVATAIITVACDVLGM